MLLLGSRPVASQPDPLRPFRLGQQQGFLQQSCQTLASSAVDSVRQLYLSLARRFRQLNQFFIPEDLKARPIRFPGFGISLPFILGLAVTSAAFIIGIAGMAVRTRRRPVVSGREQLVGATGEILQDVETEGWARVHGEMWRVRSRSPLKAGERVKVAAVEGLVLQVERQNP